MSCRNQRLPDAASDQVRLRSSRAGRLSSCAAATVGATVGALAGSGEGAESVGGDIGTSGVGPDGVPVVVAVSAGGAVVACGGPGESDAGRAAVAAAVA